MKLVLKDLLGTKDIFSECSSWSLLEFNDRAYDGGAQFSFCCRIINVVTFYVMTETMYILMVVANKRWHVCESSSWQKVCRSPTFLIIGKSKLIYYTPIPWKQLCPTRQYLILILEEKNILSAPMKIVETKMCHHSTPLVCLFHQVITKMVSLHLHPQHYNQHVTNGLKFK